MYSAAGFYLVRLRHVLTGILLLATIGLAVACQPAPKGQRAQVPTLPVRHRDALPLMLTSDDLGYQAVEKHRLERGKGWGEDTTRLSGYQVVFEGTQRAFTRVSCQIECYMTVAGVQEAHRAYYNALLDRLKGDTRFAAVQESEDPSLGDWNRVIHVRGSSGIEMYYIFIRENVLVSLAFTGSDSPELAQQAARQARAVDERIYSR